MDVVAQGGWNLNESDAELGSATIKPESPTVTTPPVLTGTRADTVFAGSQNNPQPAGTTPIKYTKP